MTSKIQPRLEVYLDRSVLVEKDGDEYTFLESTPSASAKARLELIKASLADGFLKKTIKHCADPSSIVASVSASHQKVIRDLVSSVTSEVGRAIIGLTILQLCVKSISKNQSIRLHKAGGGGGNFSWCEGIPMRVLDKSYITPVLRETGLLNLNADGFMMTRSLAENYPYSNLYKAAIRGARKEWLEIVEAVENDQLDALDALKNLILLLINRSDKFKRDANICLSAVKAASPQILSLSQAESFIMNFVSSAPYSARLFEVAMHSLFQVLDERAVLEGVLKPLSQMRSANKKHGNIGDIEVLRRRGGMEIIEAWDAKFGKLDLRDELEELGEKLLDHSETTIAGFVTDRTPIVGPDLRARIVEMEEQHGVAIQIITFDEWVRSQFSRSTDEPVVLGKAWVMAFTESLCQLRREYAPIDEPCDAWVLALSKYAATWSV